MSAFSDKAKKKHRAFSAHLCQLRKDKNHTMRTLSEAIGVPHSFIGKIENQQRRLDIAEFVLYCEGLGVDPVEAFRGMLESAQSDVK